MLLTLSPRVHQCGKSVPHPNDWDDYTDQQKHAVALSTFAHLISVHYERLGKLVRWRQLHYRLWQKACSLLLQNDQVPKHYVLPENHDIVGVCRFFVNAIFSSPMGIPNGQHRNVVDLCSLTSLLIRKRGDHNYFFRSSDTSPWLSAKDEEPVILQNAVRMHVVSVYFFRESKEQRHNVDFVPQSRVVSSLIEKEEGYKTRQSLSNV